VEQGNAQRVLVDRPEGKRPLGLSRCTYDNNIKMDFKELGWKSLESINLAQDRDQWRTLVKAVMKFRVE
jgi:hypothetical protein